MNERVSIITPSYNTANYISQTIECVLNQTYKNWEMIIVDDCSTDNTDQVVKKYLYDKRIKYLKNDANSGAAISRNRALKEVKGKWIAFLDSDDLWSKDKLEKQIRFMKENDYHFSYTNYEEIDEKNKLLGRLITGPKKITKRGMYAYCWPGCLTVMYDAEYVGLIQIKDIKKNNDYAMWLKVCKKADCYLLDEKLGKYRIRKKSISHDKLYKKIKCHYDLFRYCDNKSCIVSVWYASWNMLYGFFKLLIYKKNIHSLKSEEINI